VAAPITVDGRATWLRLVGSLTVLGTLAVAVSDRRYLTGEAAVVEALNGVPTAAGWPLRVVMQLGTLWAGITVAAAVARWVRPVLATWVVLLAVVVAFRLDNVLKDVVERPRPPGQIDGLHVRESIDGFGFPSGHSTMAFALAAALHPMVAARWRWAPWVLALVVGLGRMHVGVHWPLDVVGGAALGTAIGSAAWLVVVAAARTRPAGASDHEAAATVTTGEPPEGLDA
jgi:undecaprenyl-diphosphatase